MKLLHTLLEDDDLKKDEEEERAIIKKGHTIYKVLNKGTFTIGGDNSWSTKRTFKYRLSDNYTSTSTYEYESEETDELIRTCMLCVDKVYILFPFMSTGVKSDNVINSTLKLYEVFKKHGVNLHVGKFGNCKSIIEDVQNWPYKSNVVIVDDQEEWDEMFRS